MKDSNDDGTRHRLSSLGALGSWEQAGSSPETGRATLHWYAGLSVPMVRVASSSFGAEDMRASGCGWISESQTGTSVTASAQS